MALAVLLRPARIRVPLRTLGRTPVLRNVALLDRVVLLAAVVLRWRGHDAGVDDLPATGDEAHPRPLRPYRFADVADQILFLKPLVPYPDNNTLLCTST